MFYIIKKIEVIDPTSASFNQLSLAEQIYKCRGFIQSALSYEENDQLDVNSLYLDQLKLIIKLINAANVENSIQE